jgi:hypothetical protein
MPSCDLKSTRRAALLWGSAWLLFGVGATRAEADQLEKLALKIASGTAPVTLAEFVRQTGLQVLFDFDAVSQVTTREVDGQLDAREALSVMFEGSELTFEFINARTIAVRLRPPTSAVAQPAPRT